jgi:hypothetical protein
VSTQHQVDTPFTLFSNIEPVVTVLSNIRLFSVVVLSASKGGPLGDHLRSVTT